MSLQLLDHSAGPLPVLDTSPPGLIVGMLLVLAVAVLTVVAANALTRRRPPGAGPDGRPNDAADDIWPPPPRR